MFTWSHQSPPPAGTLGRGDSSPSQHLCTTPELHRVQFVPGDNVGPCMVKVVVVGWLEGEEVLADLLLQVCSSAPPKTLFQHCSFPRGLYSCWVEMIFLASCPGRDLMSEMKCLNI